MKKFFMATVLLLMLFGLCSCDTTDPCESGHSSDTYTYTDEPTCSHEGSIIVRCSECREVISRKSIPQLEHSSIYGEASEATCYSEGQAVYRCSDCGQEISTETLPKLEHTPSEAWEVSSEQGCTVDGEEVNKCTICQAIIDTRVIPASHTPVVLAAVPASCTAEGRTEGSQCSVCGEILLKQESIAQTSHNIVPVSAVAPTCSAYGYTEGVGCSECGLWETEPTRIDKLPHTEVDDAGKQATCTEAGRTAGKHCTVCREATIPQQTIPKLDHGYSVYNNTCPGCGAKQYEEIASRQALLDYNVDYNAIIYLDKCLTVSNESEYCHMTILSTTDYIRLVGTPGTKYRFLIVVESRETPLTIDLVNASLTSITDNPVIESTSTAKITLGFYGESCAITGKTGSAGSHGGGLFNGRNGEDGSNGFDAISIVGDLVIKKGADSVRIQGGNGGNGGDGGYLFGNDGGDGGDGGNGAYAVKASSITIVGVDGYSAQSIILIGGKGGAGGSGGDGSGFLYDDGEHGSSGKSQVATTVTPTYK